MTDIIYTEEEIRNEMWKNIKDYEGVYQISSLGRVKGLDRFYIDRWGNRTQVVGQFLRLTEDKDGYLKVGLRKQGFKQKNFFVHRLVCVHFHSNEKNKPTVNHKDGDKKNNKADNLEFADYKEQMQHAYYMGLQKPKYNEASGNNFLKNEDIKYIREMYKTSNVTQRFLAEKFGCSQGHISDIVLNKKRPEAFMQ